MSVNLDAKIEGLLHRRWVEPPSANLAERVIQKAFEMPQTKTVGDFHDFHHLKQNGKDSERRTREMRFGQSTALK